MEKTLKKSKTDIDRASDKDMENPDEMNEIKEGEHKISNKIIAAFIGMMILIPVLVIMVLYNINPEFRNTVNTFGSYIPFVSERDKNGLTPQERMERVDYLADYYTKVDEQTAVDKLYIIKQDDQKLYQDILSQMRSKSSEKTKNIIEKIRSKELNKDLLVQNYEEALGAKGDALSSTAKALESSDLLLARNELRNRLNDSDLGNLVSLINSQKLAEILYYMNASESGQVLDELDEKKATEVRNAMDLLKYDNDNLISSARILDKRPTSEAVAYIDNKADMTPEDLAVILENMSLPKASEIASGMKNRELLDQAFYQMSVLERLLEQDEGRASDISEMVDYVSEYNNKIEDLVKYYKNVDANKAAPIFEKLINNDKDVTALSMNDPEGIGKKLFKTTDRKVAVDIASKLKPKKVSEIISAMDTNVAALFTELLAHPEKAVNYDKVAEGEENLIKDPSNISLNVSFNDDNISELSNEFSKRATDLATAFNQMDPKELSKIVKSMLQGTSENKRTIANILSKTTPQTMANLLTNLSIGDRTTLSNLMVTDNVKETFQTDSFEAADKVSEELAKVYNSMQPVPLATLIKRTVDDAYDYEDTENLETLIRVLEKMNPDLLSQSLDLLNPDMSGEITDLIYQYKNKREVKE